MGRVANKGVKNEKLAKLIAKLAKNLNAARLEKGLTLQQLASAAHVATSTIWELESQRATDFRMSTLLAVARVLDCDPLDLLK